MSKPVPYPGEEADDLMQMLVKNIYIYFNTWLIQLKGMYPEGPTSKKRHYIKI